jgi:hypothetical protein
LLFPFFGSFWKEPLLPLWNEPLVPLWKEPLVPLWKDPLVVRWNEPLVLAVPAGWFSASLDAGSGSMAGDPTAPVVADAPAWLACAGPV